MNALMDNSYTKRGAHSGSRRLTQGTPVDLGPLVCAGTATYHQCGARTIHDFGGFPPELCTRLQYPAPGDPDLARRVQRMLAPLPAMLDNSWDSITGHGPCSATCIPTRTPRGPAHIDETQAPALHYEIGRKLAPYGTKVSHRWVREPGPQSARLRVGKARGRALRLGGSF